MALGDSWIMTVWRAHTTPSEDDAVDGGGGGTIAKVERYASLLAETDNHHAKKTRRGV